MLATTTRRNAAFSLIELVIVVVIIGIIAAIAIPRMSRGATGAADNALTADLATLRNAIDLYHAEHGGTYPDLVTSPNYMLQYTDDTGAISAVKDATHIYGPYLRSVPKLPVGADKNQSSFVLSYTAGNGWDYDKSTGNITANCGPGEKDARGTLYSSY